MICFVDNVGSYQVSVFFFIMIVIGDVIIVEMIFDIKF